MNLLKNILSWLTKTTQNKVDKEKPTLTLYPVDTLPRVQFRGLFIWLLY